MVENKCGPKPQPDNGRGLQVFHRGGRFA